MTTPTDDVTDYVERETEKAVAGVAGGLDRRGGRLLGTESWSDGHGHWLRVRARLDARPNVEIHFARLLLHHDGPQMDAENEGIVYGSGFVERLLTRLPGRALESGVVTL